MTTSSPWRTKMADAISEEISTWTKNMTTVCVGVDRDRRFASPDAPWIRGLAWLNLALSGGTLISRVAPYAFVGTLASHLVAERMRQRYQGDVKLSNSELTQRYRGVLSEFISEIDEVGRSFFIGETGRLAEGMIHLIASLADTKSARSLLAGSVDTRGKYSEHKLEDHLRKIIARSGVLPTDARELESRFVEAGFAAYYDQIQAIVMRSNLVPESVRKRGVVYQPYNGQPLAFPGTAEEICVGEDRLETWVGTSCLRPIRAIQAKERNDYLTLLAGMWRFDIHIESTTQEGHHFLWGRQSIPVKHVRVSPRGEERSLAVTRYPTTYEVNAQLEKAFHQYAATVRPAAAAA